MDTTSYYILATIIASKLGIYLLSFKMIKDYCKEYHSKNIMNITMILFPSIFVHLEKAQVKNEIRTHEDEKKFLIKTEQNEDEEIQVHEPELDVSLFCFLLRLASAS